MKFSLTTSIRIFSNEDSILLCSFGFRDYNSFLRLMPGMGFGGCRMISLKSNYQRVRVCKVLFEMEAFGIWVLIIFPLVMGALLAFVLRTAQ